MTPIRIRRYVAQVEAHDLRRYPPRLWPHVTANARGLLLCAIAHGRIPRHAALELPLTVRCAR